jgi:C-terminal processing protease CtpA/Prc
MRSLLFVLGVTIAQPALAQQPPMQAASAQQTADAPITAAEARQTATDLAQMLEENYVFPDVAKRYAAMLRANAASGAYDVIRSARALAARLTTDLRAVSTDAHLRVTTRVPEPKAQNASAPVQPRFPWKPIEEERWLAPGIAYIRFNVFPGDPDTVAAVKKFMLDHATAKVIVFDNRTHHGGGLAEMNAMFPYLFAKPTTLVMMDTRASVSRDGEAFVRKIPGPPGVVRREHYVEPSKTERRLFNAKVFVLTSGATGSAAEHMTLALKRTHRATIIGEPTAGAGHYGGEMLLGDKFEVFVPVGRTFDPDTGKDWEGTGVEPDVSVPAADALTEALIRSGLSRADAQRINATVKPSGSMKRPIPRRLAGSS